MKEVITRETEDLTINKDHREEAKKEKELQEDLWTICTKMLPLEILTRSLARSSIDRQKGTSTEALFQTRTN